MFSQEMKGYRLEGTRDVISREEMIKKVTDGKVSPINFLVRYESCNLSYEEETEDTKAIMACFVEDEITKGNISVALITPDEKDDKVAVEATEISLIEKKEYGTAIKYDGELYSKKQLTIKTEEAAEKKAEKAKEESKETEGSKGPYVVYNDKLQTDPKLVARLIANNVPVERVAFMDGKEEIMGIDETIDLFKVNPSIVKAVYLNKQMDSSTLGNILSNYQSKS